MNVVQAAVKARKDAKDKESDSKNGSPVKGLLGGHNPKVPNETIQLNPGRKKMKTFVPTKIEEIPFRRQDRRIINSRKKRIVDRRLIKFIVFMGILMILIGAAMIVVWIVLRDGKREVY